ncbi:MAG TPA: type 1 glutamine amidotransferase [Solirubrobacteraceae bacterium]|nr:type 1 glutamine amidotransferase [Solirubrobacteraceae bacterium]
MRALVIQHGEDGPGGHVTDWLAAHDALLDVFRIDVDHGERDPGDYDLIVSLGSERAAYDDTLSWVPRELRILAAAADADVPVLGICFGSQLLARALGAEAMRAEKVEIGWVPIRALEPSLVGEGPWLQWHYDTFSLPAGAKLLAESPAGPQAYTAGRSLGVQFHPEVTAEIVANWISQDGAALRRQGLDPVRLLAETRERDAENRARAVRLMDVFVDQVAGL